MLDEVKLGDDARADLSKLPRPALLEAFAELGKIKANPFVGGRLAVHPLVGDLSDCWKLPFGGSVGSRTRYRIVYQLTPNDASPRRANVVVIGPRANLAVYYEAVRRLDRDARSES